MCKETYNFIIRQRHAKLLCDGTVVRRVRRAALRKAALVGQSHQVGDIVSYCREARAGEHGLQWSVGSRLIGFEQDRNSLGETQPRTCWVICDSVPVCVAVDRLRTCTPAELFAFHYTQTKSSSPLATDAQIQQGFIDGRAPLNPITVRRELPMKARTNTSGTTKCQSQHKQKKNRKAKGDSEGRNSKRVTGIVTHN